MIIKKKLHKKKDVEANLAYQSKNIFDSSSMTNLDRIKFESLEEKIDMFDKVASIFFMNLYNNYFFYLSFLFFCILSLVSLIVVN